MGFYVCKKNSPKQIVLYMYTVCDVISYNDDESDQLCVCPVSAFPSDDIPLLRSTNNHLQTTNNNKQRTITINNCKDTEK